ncbi:MAG: AarF/ABC1/UbiB kinase family protein [bacterium]|nr:AarF/ABC1/UbiB kinase family protein [bacterium]
MIKIKQLTELTHAYRHFKRYRQIIHVLIKYGFGSLIESVGLHKIIGVSKKIFTKNKDYKWETISASVRLRMVLSELGPTFIKLGQILATRPDLVPLEFSEELAKLQDDAPRFSYEDVKNIIIEEFGAMPEEMFDSFEEEPLAAASIGQVHRACYKGNQVIVKVQRPKIKEIIEADLEILYHFAVLLEKHIYELSAHKPSMIVKEFAKSLEKEIDFMVELKNTARFAIESTEEGVVYAPKIYKEVSTKRVLVAEFINGIKASDIEALKKEGYDLKLIAERGANSLLKQIFVHGYFHGDPHPGNIFICPGNVICFIDFGMMGRISWQERENFSSFLLYLINRKINKIVDTLLKFTSYEDEPDREDLEREISLIIDEYLVESLGEIDFGKILESLMILMSENNLRLKPNMFMMLKALISLEDIAVQLNPNMNIIEMSKPYIKEIQLERFKFKNIFFNGIDSISDILRLASDLPNDIRVLIKKAKLGKMKFELEYIGLEKFRKSMVKSSNRVVMAIIIAALLVSHSLILLIPVGRYTHLIRLEGVIGFMLSVVFGFILLIAMILSRNK